MPAPPFWASSSPVNDELRPAPAGDLSICLSADRGARRHYGRMNHRATTAVPSSPIGNRLADSPLKWDVHVWNRYYGDGGRWTRRTRSRSNDAGWQRDAKHLALVIEDVDVEPAKSDRIEQPLRSGIQEAANVEKWRDMISRPYGTDIGAQ